MCTTTTPPAAPRPLAALPSVGLISRACRIIHALNATRRSALSAAILHAQTNNIAHSIAADVEAVNLVIRQRLHSEVSLVNQIAEYIISAGGKRIRPTL